MKGLCYRIRQIIYNFFVFFCERPKENLTAGFSDTLTVADDERGGESTDGTWPSAQLQRNESCEMRGNKKKTGWSLDLGGSGADTLSQFDTLPPPKEYEEEC